MPTFSLTELRTARVTVGNPNPVALVCTVRFVLGSAPNALTWNSSALTISAGQTAAVDFPIRMSDRGEGTWPVYVHIYDLGGNVMMSVQGENVQIIAPLLTPNWDGLIAAATSISGLDAIRYGPDGFETWYLAGKITYDEYLRLYYLYLDRRAVLASAAPAKVNVTLRHRNAPAKAAYWYAMCDTYPWSDFIPIGNPIYWSNVPANTPQTLVIFGSHDANFQPISSPNAGSGVGFSRLFENGKTYYWDFASGILLDENLLWM